MGHIEINKVCLHPSQQPEEILQMVEHPYK